MEAILTWLWWLLGALVALAVVDRFATWAESHGWIYWRRRSGSANGGAGLAGELLDAFQPSRKVVQEERMRQEMRIEHSESGAPRSPAQADKTTEWGSLTMSIDESPSPSGAPPGDPGGRRPAGSPGESWQWGMF